MRDLQDSAVLATFTRGLSLIVALIAQGIYARIGGVQFFGAFAISMSLLFVVVELVDFGNSTQAARNSALRRLSFDSLRQSFSLIMFRGLPVTLFCALSIIYVDPDFSLLYLVVALNLVPTTLSIYFQQFCFAHKKNVWANTSLIIEKLGWCSVWPLYLWGISARIAIPTSIVFGSFLSIVYILICLSRGEDTHIEENSNLLEFWKKENGSSFVGNKSIFGFRLFGNIGYLDNLLVGILFGHSAAGVYAAGSRLRVPLIVGFTSVGDLVVGDVLKSERTTGLAIKRDYLIVVILNLLACCLAALFSNPISILLYGPNFVEASFAIFWFSIASIFIGVSSIIRSFLVAIGREIEVLKVTVYSTVSLFIGIVVLSYIADYKASILYSFVNYALITISYLTIYLKFKRRE